MTKERDDWNRKFFEMKAEYQQNYDELKRDLEKYKTIQIEMNSLQIKFDAERIAYETQISQLTQQVDDYENQVKHTIDENERLTMKSISQMKVIQELKGNLSKVEITQGSEIATLK